MPILSAKQPHYLPMVLISRSSSLLFSAVLVTYIEGVSSKGIVLVHSMFSYKHGGIMVSIMVRL